jgi:cytochrome b involved in lipid metabolism
LQKFGLVTALRRAEEKDLLEAIRYMQEKEKAKLVDLDLDVDSWDGEFWNIARVKEFTQRKTGRCFILINGFVVDATPYLGEHVSVNTWVISCTNAYKLLLAWRCGYPSKVFDATSERRRNVV